MRKFLEKNRILLLVIFLAAVLRLWALSANPPHLAPDEAALGYNAYSILKTGRDEYGEFLPVIFKSFGDYKPGLYIYLTVPFVALFGLTEFAVRLPAALAGIGAVWLLYLVVGELFKNKNYPLLASFFLAISPWHINFSRGAWEALISLTLTLAGIYFFLRAIKGRHSWIIISALFFALTLLAYQGAKLATGIVGLGLLIIFGKQLLKIEKKYLAGAVLIGAFLAFPILVSFFQGKTGRLEVFSVFSYPTPTEYVEKILEQGDKTRESLTYSLYHSEPLNFAQGILGRWTNHYSARFLFFEGDWANPRHSAPYSGVLILADLALLIAGFVGLVRLGKRRETLFAWWWLILAPLPAALSRDSIHAVRALNLVIPLALLLALGAAFLWEKRKKLFPLVAVFGAVYLVNYSYFLDQYFIHNPAHNSQYWEYGYKQIVEVVTPIQQEYEEIRVRLSFAQPYIYFLFYQQYDPTEYQKQAKLVEGPVAGDVGQVEHLDNICFCPIDWSVNRGASGKLFVADLLRIPREDSQDPELFKLISEIKYLNGKTAFRVIEVK